MEQVNVITERCRRASWGSILAGVATVLAVSFLLSLIGTSIGLFMLDPTDSDPFSGVGTSVGIWTVVSLLVSLAAGGFVAGKLAARDGIIHGFLTWAVSLIITVVLGTMMVSSAVKMTGNLLGSISHVTGNILSGVGSAVADGASGVASLFDGMDIDVNGNEVRQDVRETLRKTGVKELQPGYIDNQLAAVRSDLQKSVKRLAANPQQAEPIINDFSNRLQNRIDQYTSNIDREEVVTAVMNTTNLSRAEAESTVDQYMALLQQGRNSLDNLQQEIREAEAQWQQMKQDALRKSEEVANKAAWTSIWSFFALLIGAALAGFAGRYGATKTWQGYEA